MKQLAHLFGHLPYLEALYAQENFTRAAESMHITQAAMSYQIKQLEMKLDVSLVLRKSGSQVIFTREGESLVREYSCCAKRLNCVIESMHADENGGVLRISAPVDLGSLVMPKVIARLKQLAPKLAVQLHISDSLIDLESSSWDFAVRVNSNENVGNNNPIFRSAMCIVVRPSYLAQTTIPKSLKALRQHQLLTRNSAKQNSWNALFASKNMQWSTFNTFLALGTTVALREAAIEGLGIALLPTFVVSSALQTGCLTSLLASSCRGLFAEYQLARLPISQLDKYEDILRQAFSSLDSSLCTSS